MNQSLTLPSLRVLFMSAILSATALAAAAEPTLKRLARLLAEPQLWPREPPVRFRKSVPTAWLELVIREGRNRQVRRMTAAVGLPTLRLVRVKIGDWTLDGLDQGCWRDAPPKL